MKKFRIVVWAIVAVVILGMAGIFIASPKSSLRNGAPETNGLLAVTDDAFGGPFSLMDQDGKTVTEKDFSGQYRLMYFGFTYCPAICPTELAKITKALNALGDKSKTIHPLFVTVDPERDTAAKLKGYITLFHPSLTGLTGTPDQVKVMLKDYKVYAAKVDDPQLGDYTMDHSSFIYFIAPDGRLLHIFKMEDTAEQMAQIMSAWIDQENAR